ncbi:MAG: MOSC N-terminal beta barrel domain-containing protein [Pseudomonadota bacterium]
MTNLRMIYRYPVKGFSGQRLARVDCLPYTHLPLDRVWALALDIPGEEFVSQWQSKRSFFQLAAHPKLANLQSEFDQDDNKLQILRKGRIVAQGNLDTQAGRQVLETFFVAFLQAQGARPRIVRAEKGSAFSDQKHAYISLINLASVRDIGRVLTQELNPMRFRGNLYIDGGEPWQEWSWLGAVGAGSRRAK